MAARHSPSPLVCVLSALLIGAAAGPSRSVAEEPTAPGLTAPDHLAHGYRYRHEEVKQIPWSIHVFEFDRSRADLSIATTLGGGTNLGLGTVSEQVKAMSAGSGTAVAAVNGDFFNTDHSYPGDPRDLQIQNGELVSGPQGHACFWLDTSGQPHSTNIISHFEVRWPDGSTTPFGLNEVRDHDTVVLYTAANGSSTRTSDGVELVLEGVPDGDWLPLHAGQKLRARVREYRKQGNSPIDRLHPVLSVGPKLSARTAHLVPGAILELSTATFPDLTGVKTAVGGGPTLVHDGRALTWTSATARHPRTAIGWNHDRFFLVEVDGRQDGLSAGMSFPELAGYMAKLGCEEAVNLDGGGSATMWVCGQVMNSPSEGRERPAANTIVVVQRRADSSTRAP